MKGSKSRAAGTMTGKGRKAKAVTPDKLKGARAEKGGPSKKPMKGGKRTMY